MDKDARNLYILNVIQAAVLQCCEVYNWDRSVFENAYQEVLNGNFNFIIPYPAKQSKDRKKTAHICIEKHRS
ncbi:hypothetical protein [Paraflavitalea speifideaquila]|uniref:hypothetical protein n=1 Tax=Paraflavitalea speifideaquila TaxID=3076558 RepID=UPI0028EEE5F2|nr:hypothetical protein [Paraflavitalea speifideiaquila]